jgi:GDP-L-fucose synthase
LNRNARIYVAGADTLLGAALRTRLQAAGYDNLVGLPPGEPEFTCPRQVDDFFAHARPQHVFLTAGKSGGIHANQAYPAALMRDNLLVIVHVLHAAYRHGAAKLLYLASSCSYPRLAPQPMRVESLLTGPLEPTNEGYALAKLTGLKVCEAYRHQYGAHFITAIPANSFGPHDDFTPENSHVIPGLIRRLHAARLRGQDELDIWGTGQARREFLYGPDLADACLFVMNHYDAPEPINLGGGPELSIAEVARAVAEVVGYRGRLRFDTNRPDGMPRKVLDAGPLFQLGWRPKTDFRTALVETFHWFLRNVAAEECKDVRTAV